MLVDNASVVDLVTVWFWKTCGAKGCEATIITAHLTWTSKPSFHQLLSLISYFCHLYESKCGFPKPSAPIWLWHCIAYKQNRRDSFATESEQVKCDKSERFLRSFQVQSACMAMPVSIPSDAGPAQTFQELLLDAQGVAVCQDVTDGLRKHTKCRDLWSYFFLFTVVYTVMNRNCNVWMCIKMAQQHPSGKSDNTMIQSFFKFLAEDSMAPGSEHSLRWRGRWTEWKDVLMS